MRPATHMQRTGKVARIQHGSVMSIVKVERDGGEFVTAAITMEAVEELGLVIGGPVVVLVKSTEVMLAVE